jgi:hypothetical protein
LQNFWQDNFPASLSPLVCLRFFATGLASLGCDFLLPSRLESLARNPAVQLIVFAPIIVGLLASLRKPVLLTFSAVPIATAIGLALVKRYPFGNARTSLYLAPCFILLFARGLEAIWERFPKAVLAGWKPATAWLLAGMLAVLVLYSGLKDFRKPAVPPMEDGFAAVQSLRQSVSANDLIYVHASARFQTRLYLKMIGWEPAHIVYGNTGWPCCSLGVDFQKANHDASFFQQDFRRVLAESSSGKTWFIYSTLRGPQKFVGRNEANLQRELLNAMACRQEDDRTFAALTVRSFACPAP